MRHAATTLNVFRLLFELMLACTVCAMNITLALGAFLIAWGVL